MRTHGWIAVLVLACTMIATPVFGQGGTTSATLSGMVKDNEGTVPGATVIVKKTSTGETIGPRVTNKN